MSAYSQALRNPSAQPWGGGPWSLGPGHPSREGTQQGDCTGELTTDPRDSRGLGRWPPGATPSVRSL